jgi:hypothetical protein
MNHNCCGGRQPTPTFQRDRGGGRNARATSFAFARVFRNVPRRFTLENHRLLQALPQSSGKLRKLSRFRALTFPHIPVARKKKTAPSCAETVDDPPWLWKPEENLEEN